MYRFPCIHAIRRPNISLTFRIAVRIRIAELPRITMSTTTFTRHNPAVARSCAWLSSCRPRGSCGSMIRVRIVPARRLHHAITSFRLDTACASLARLLARWRLASRKPRDWNGGSDRPARATKESKTKTLEHEAQLARDTQPFRHASTLKGTAHACKSSDCIRDDSAKSDTSTQGIRHPIPTTPPGDPHNAFS